MNFEIQEVLTEKSLDDCQHIGAAIANDCDGLVLEPPEMVERMKAELDAARKLYQT